MRRMSITGLTIPVAIAFFVAPFSYVLAAEQGEVDRAIRVITPPISLIEEREKAPDQWFASCFYEPSDIKQGNRTGHWNELDTTIAYIHDNIRAYIVGSQFERFDVKDATFSVGSYLSFKDSYSHLEVGFGQDCDYMQKFQSIAEYGHRAYKTLYWQLGYNYRAYGTDDTHMIYPSLIYYFGDSFISLNFGVTCMEAHDTATFGTVNGSFAITDFLQWDGSVAFGQRLYDIYSLDADQEDGYILSTGLTFRIYKDIKFRFGYSYGTEDPKFIKRSINFLLSAKM